jgi:RNA polymerase sigma-70 factor, ECF subfamily
MVTGQEKDTGLTALVDEQLVARAQRGDGEAFVELMCRTRRSSARLASSILRDPWAAEDEVQNAYLKAWQYLGQFQGGAKFSTWLLRIVTNQCLMHLRQLRRARMTSIEEVKTEWGGCAYEVPDTRVTVEEGLRQRELIAGLRQQIRRLPALLQKTLELHDVDQVPVEEVASRLGITTAAAKSRLCRARTELRKRMEPYLAIDRGARV